MILEYTDKNSEEKGHKFRTTLLMMQNKNHFFWDLQFERCKGKSIFVCRQEKNGSFVSQFHVAVSIKMKRPSY